MSLVDLNRLNARISQCERASASNEPNSDEIEARLARLEKALSSVTGIVNSLTQSVRQLQQAQASVRQ